MAEGIRFVPDNVQRYLIAAEGAAAGEAGEQLSLFA